MDILEYDRREEARTFTVINDAGEELTCEILVAFESDETGKYYLVYTDRTVDEDGNLTVYASVCDPAAAELTLLPIETDEEWDMVEDALEHLEDTP